MWPHPCGCKPGTYDDGWQEVRSPECLAHEHQIWADMIRKAEEANRIVRLTRSTQEFNIRVIRNDGSVKNLRTE